MTETDTSIPPEARTFRPPRDRDAWATIRGFVFQVDRTILQWLSLPPDCVLEPEAGEDLDLVSQQLWSAPSLPARTLEQIKHRDRRVTMRSTEVRAALVSFHEHRHVNPGLQLRFRYLTNASIARERPCPFPPGTTGIAVWNATREAESTDAAALDGLRSLASGGAPPAKLSRDQWNGFVSYVREASDPDWNAFVRTVEFSCQAPGAEELRGDVHTALIAQGLASPESVSHAYERLFLHVFKLLSRPGPRRLASPDLAALLDPRGGPDSADAEQLGLVQRLVTKLLQLEPRVDLLARRVEAIAGHIDQTITATAAFLVAPGQLVPPPPPHILCVRQDDAASVVAATLAHSWVAIHGPHGMGKSELVRQAAVSRWTHVVWIRLRDMSSMQASCSIDIALRSSKSPGESEGGRCIVLDDLPDPAPGDLLEAQLLHLVTEAGASATSIISTSLRRLPKRLSDSLGGELQQIEAPPITREDVERLLRATAAPDSLVSDAWLNFLLTLSRGYPLMLAAACAHLKAYDWKIDRKAIDELFAGEHLECIHLETTRRLLQTVPDEQTRQFLHRARIGLADLRLSDLLALARVSPEISEPRTRLRTVEDVWMQRVREEAWILSPVLRALPDGDLQPTVSRDCHRALADSILDSRKPSPFLWEAVLLHYLEAAEFERFGSFLLRGCVDALGSSELPAARAFLRSLGAYDVPASVPTSLRISCLAMQVAGLAAGSSPMLDGLLDRKVTELDEAIRGSASEDTALARYHAGIVLGHRMVDRGSLRYLRMALEAAASIDLPDGLGSVAERLLWFAVPRVSSKESFADWIAIIRALTSVQLTRLVEDELYPAGAFLVANSVYLRESDKPEANRAWNVALEELDELERAGRDQELAMLSLAAVRAKSIILGEGLRRPQDALAVLEEASGWIGTDATARFVLHDARAKQFLAMQDYAKALPELQSALQVREHELAADAVWTAMRAGLACSLLPGCSPLPYALEAAARADAIPDCPPLTACRAFGERGVAEWLVQDFRGAYRSLARLASNLLAIHGDSPEWRGMVAVTAHVLAYISNQVARGIRLKKAGDGGEYAPPAVGMFLRSGTLEGEIYTPDRMCVIPGFLVQLAHAVGEREDAAAWAQKALDLVYQNESGNARLSLAVTAAPYLLRAGHIEDAVESAWIAASTAGPAPGSSETGWSHADRGLLVLVFPAVSFFLTTSIIMERRQGEDMLRRFCGALRTVASRSGAEAPWAAIASTLLDCATGDSHDDAANAVMKLAGDSGAVVRAVANLLSTAHPDALAEHAAIAHAKSVPLLWDLVAGDAVSRDLVLEPFAREVWPRFFSEQRVRFNLPRNVERKLERAAKMTDPLSIAQGMLEAVWADLKAPVGHAGRVWLAKRRPSSRGQGSGSAE